MREKKIGPHAGPPAHLPPPPRLAVFMSVIHAPPAGPNQPPKQPATPTKQPPFSTLHRALRRMAGLVFLLVSWVLAGACQRHGVGGFLFCNSSSSKTSYL